MHEKAHIKIRIRKLYLKIQNSENNNEIQWAWKKINSWIGSRTRTLSFYSSKSVQLSHVEIAVLIGFKSFVLPKTKGVSEWVCTEHVISNENL
jgi:hypothetical protein